MVDLELKEMSGVVLISGLSSQPVALQLCSRLKSQGAKSTIGMLPGVPGYQVSVYQLSIDEVKVMLAQLAVEPQGGG